MARGTVKVVTDKGYGFIQTKDAEKDVFYHENNLSGELAQRKLMTGDEVTFDIERTEKGMNAVNIKLVGSDDASEGSDSADTEEDMDQAA